MAQILIITGVAIFGILGSVHLYFTFFTNKFDPHDLSMKNAMMLRFSILTIAITGLLNPAMPLLASEVDQSKEKMLAQEARALIKTYAGQLKSALSQSIKKDGAIAAINVCARMSPKISFKLSEDSSWTINRTSLKPRNSANEPDAWEQSVMEKFLKQQQNGEVLHSIEHFELTENDTIFRYMKAIPTGQLCLTCHGTNIASDLKEAIAVYYPDDKATDFKMGDMRGAFTLQKDLTEKE